MKGVKQQQEREKEMLIKEIEDHKVNRIMSGYTGWFVMVF